MPAITIPDVPPELHRRLEEAAARHGRSVGREVLALIERALDESYKVPPVEPIKGRFDLTPDWLEDAIREGRA